MRSLGLVSAMAMAARKPAPPPPTSTTSCEGVTTAPGDRAPPSGSSSGDQLVDQHGPVVADHSAGDRPVVVFVPDVPAAARVEHFIADQTIVILVPQALAVHSSATWGRSGREAGSGGRHRCWPPSPRSAR